MFRTTDPQKHKVLHTRDMDNYFEAVKALKQIQNVMANSNLKGLSFFIHLYTIHSKKLSRTKKPKYLLLPTLVPRYPEHHAITLYSRPEI